MEISKYLREHARTIKGKQQLIIDAYARALEVIPRQLCDNAGFDSTDILNKLRMRHARGETWAGVDNFEKFVWEPALVKINAIKSATEAATMIVSIDETIKAEQSQQPGSAPQMSRGQAQQVLRGMGRGRGMPRR